MISGRLLQERFMFDRGHIAPANVATLGGEPIPTYPTLGDEVRCRIDYTAPDETRDGAHQTVGDVTLYFPLSLTVTPTDRVKITVIFGHPVDPPEWYAVLGEPVREASCQWVRGARLQGGSTR